MRLLLVSTLLVFSGACGGSSDDGGSGEPCGASGACPAGELCSATDQVCRSAGVHDVVANVTGPGGDITVSQQSGQPPAAGSGPTSVVTAPGTAINGGTVQVNIVADQPFDRVVIRVVGIDGYYDIGLPELVSSVDLLLSLSQDLGGSSITFAYSVGSASGVGSYAEVPTTLVSVGTGEVQVSVSWDVETDVDLHVVDPSGNEVYYGQPAVPSGGMLDLDSNAACSIDHVKNENITWSTAPSGEYTVRLDYYDACALAETKYTVTVNVKDQESHTFSGTFDGVGDGGSAGSGILITTFTVP